MIKFEKNVSKKKKKGEHLNIIYFNQLLILYITIGN